MSRWRQETGRWTVTLLVLGVSCGGNPTAPAPIRGVTIYQHPNFGGDHYAFNSATSFPNFSFLVGPCGSGGDPFSPVFSPVSRNTWHRCVSSVKVAEGWSATVFERDDFAGQELSITSDIRDLDDIPGPCGGDWDDCIASIRVSQQ